MTQRGGTLFCDGKSNGRGTRLRLPWNLVARLHLWVSSPFESAFERIPIVMVIFEVHVYTTTHLQRAYKVMQLV
jgi:hypothetical protein